MSLRKLEQPAGRTESPQTVPHRSTTPKPRLLKYHVTSEGLSLRVDAESEQAATRLGVPQGFRHSGTWPTTPRERLPGSIVFDTVPTLVRNPRAHRRSLSLAEHVRRQNSARYSVGKSFVHLAQEIYRGILRQLKGCHSSSQGIDVSSWQADLRSLSLADKRWHRAAREQLYGDLWLPVSRAPSRRRLSFQRLPDRLRQLLDVLRASPGLAFLVHHIRVKSALASALDVEARDDSRKHAMLDILEELIYICPNLEHLSGCVLPLSPSTVDFYRALTSCTRLKSQAWYIGSKAALVLPALDFVQHHDNWAALEGLVLSVDPTVELGSTTISAILASLPSLRHLMLAGLDRRSFHNGSLLLLPALTSLRLDSLPGVTEQGIEQLAHTRISLTLESLSLIRMELPSLHAVKMLFVHLLRLRRFTFVQDTSPEPLFGMHLHNMIRTLGSSSLQYLHWDCVIPGSALSNLAEAIERGNFPQLRTVKVPCDYDGSIQALCRPIARPRLTAADLEFFTSQTGRTRYARSLRLAQIQAQLRTRESRQRPSMNVVVQDETMEVQHTRVLGSYLGDMRSRIEYDLEPGVGGEALVEFGHVAYPFSKARREGFERELDVGLLF